MVTKWWQNGKYEYKPVSWLLWITNQFEVWSQESRHTSSKNRSRILDQFSIFVYYNDSATERTKQKQTHNS